MDGKNMLHCIRLLAMCREIVEEGTMNIFRKDRDYLLSIRKGEVDLNELVEFAKEELIVLKKLYLESDLSDDVDLNILHDIVYEIRSKHGKQTS